MPTKIALSLFAGPRSLTKPTFVDSSGTPLPMAACDTQITGISFANGTLTFSKSDNSQVVVSGFATLDSVSVGETGPTGPPGAPGKPGKFGGNGSMGKTGCQGIPGPEGRGGKAGKLGESGGKGISGESGKVGVAGTIGHIGEPGLSGEIGAAGPPGPAGPPGVDGIVVPDSGNLIGDNGTNAALPIIVSPVDPGAVGAGHIWVRA